MRLSKEKIYFHGSSQKIDKFNQPINWVSEDVNYAINFALAFSERRKGYLHTVTCSCTDPIDCGNTSKRVYELSPITKPFKFSTAFIEILKKLGVGEECGKNLIKEVLEEQVDDSFSYEYKLPIHVVTRTKAFKRIAESNGFDCILTLEDGNECLGIFNPEDITITEVDEVTEKDLTRNLADDRFSDEFIDLIMDDEDEEDEDNEDDTDFDDSALNDILFGTLGESKHKPITRHSRQPNFGWKGYERRTVPIDKVISDTGIRTNNSVLGRRDSVWGKSYDDYTYDDDYDFVNEPIRLGYDGNKYSIKDGSHRLIALQNGGYTTVDALVKDTKLHEAGYYGYSMSNNAVSAYENGEKPMSKWTKQNILDMIKEIDESKVQLASKLTLKELKDYFLRYSSWHHTSKEYNETKFYSVSEEQVEQFNQEEFDRIKGTTPTKKEEPKSYEGSIEYIEWEGTRKRPKAIHKELKDVTIQERGSFYVVFDKNGNEILRKKIGSNGTFVHNKKEDEERAKRIAELDRKEKEATMKAQNDSISKTSSKALPMYRDFLNHPNNYEKSYTCHIYKIGRKPSRDDYYLGLDKFFEVGEERLSPNQEYVSYSGYKLEVWDGNKWVESK